MVDLDPRFEIMPGTKAKELWQRKIRTKRIAPANRGITVLGEVDA